METAGLVRPICRDEKGTLMGGGGGPNIPSAPIYNIPQTSQYGSGQYAAFQNMQGLANGLGSSYGNAGNALYQSTYPGASSLSGYNQVLSYAPILQAYNQSSFGAIPSIGSLSGMNGLNPYQSSIQGSALGQARYLTGNANNLLNNAFNTGNINSLYNMLLNANNNSINATLAERGLNQSGAGAQMYGDLTNQFNTQFANNMLNEQANALNTAGGAYAGSQSLLNNATSIPLNQILAGLQGTQAGLGNASSLLMSLGLLPNTAAAQTSSLGNNVLNNAWGNLQNQYNLQGNLFNSAQTPINAQNQLATNMLNLGVQNAQGNKAGYGALGGGALGALGSLGSAGIMSSALNPISSAGAAGGDFLGLGLGNSLVP